MGVSNWWIVIHEVILRYRLLASVSSPSFSLNLLRPVSRCERGSLINIRAFKLFGSEVIYITSATILYLKQVTWTPPEHRKWCREIIPAWVDVFQCNSVLWMRKTVPSDSKKNLQDSKERHIFKHCVLATAAHYLCVQSWLSLPHHFCMS